MHDRALDALPLVVENLHGMARHHRPVAVLQIGDRLGEGGERHRVGADEHLAVAMADRKRAAAAGGDEEILLAGEKDGEREGAFKPLQRVRHGLDRLQPAVERHGDQMRDDFRVGLARQRAPGGLDLALQRLKILDDAVMDDGDAVGRLRMRIRFGRSAMRRPARMADAGGAGKRLALEPRLEIDELAFGAAARQVAVLKRSDAGRIVAAIFKPPQRVDDLRRDRLSAQNADDPAHRPTPRVPHRASREAPLRAEIKVNCRI